jgi:hypothetical protein
MVVPVPIPHRPELVILPLSELLVLNRKEKLVLVPIDPFADKLFPGITTVYWRLF